MVKEMSIYKTEVKTTSTTRPLLNKTPEDAKRRVDVAASGIIGGKARICIIEKSPPECSVEYMHCIPRSYGVKPLIVSFAAQQTIRQS
jgi:hypothetical protein